MLLPTMMKPLSYLLMSLVLLLFACSQAEEQGSGYTPDYPIKPLDNSPVLPQPDKELVVHRGANHRAPENTYAAAARAIELGVAYVEVDVRLSLDGIHYILHDFTLGRTTDGWGPIRLRTASYVDQLDAGSWYDETYAQEPVPRLYDYLRWIKGKCNVYLDIKDANLPEVVAMIRELGMEDEVFCWFGDDNMANTFYQLAPDIALKVNAANPEDVRRAKETLGAAIIECNVSQISPQMRNVCQELDIRIMAYASTNTREEFEAVIRSQADLVNLDRPGLYLQVLDSLNSF